VSVLLYAAAPFTGRADQSVLDLSLVTTRYLLPAEACGALALALAGRAGTLALAAALVWNLIRSWDLGDPFHPPLQTLIVGALAGVAVAAVIRRAPRPALLLAAPLLAIVLALQAPGFMGRVGRIEATSTAPLELWFDAQPGFHDASTPIAMSPVVDGTLGGDRVRHPVRLIGAREPCARVRARLGEGWVAVRYGTLDFLLTPRTAPACLGPVPPAAVVGEWRIYRQIATRSSAASTSPPRSSKSSGTIDAATGSGSRRARLSSRS
jgi:hypothetical protein